MILHKRHPLFVGTALVAPLFFLTGCFAGGPVSGDASGDARISAVMFLPPRAANNPFTDDAFKLSRLSVIESLTALGPKGSAEPLLATEWEQSDPNTWRFTIREGVTFHDGTEMTPESVVASLEAAKSAEPRPRVLDGVEMELTVEGNDVIIQTAEETPLLAEILASPQLPILAESAFADGKADVTKTATGPFMQVDLNGSSTATFDRYDDYWGGAAATAGIDLSYVPDGAARAAALRTGTADVVEQIPTSQSSLMDPELLHSIPTSRTTMLLLNPESPTFKDPDLRAVARAAVDKEKLVQTVYEGQADPATGLLGPAVPWAAPLREPADHGDEPAGKANGETVTLATYSDAPELPEMAIQLEQAWEAAGFVVQQEIREYASIEGDMLAGAFDAVILGRNTALDTGDPVAFMSSDFTCDGSYNLTQLCEESIDEAIDNAGSLPAGEGRQKAIIEAESAILHTDAVIPLVFERVIQGESARISDLVRDPFQRRLITPDTSIEEN